MSTAQGQAESDESPARRTHAPPIWAAYLPPATILVLFLLLALLWANGHESAYHAVLNGFGLNIYEPTPPFIDTEAILAAIQCHAAGVDVFHANPCDIGNRILAYGSAWLWLSPLGLKTSMTLPVGALLDLTFIAALFLLPPARRWREVFILGAASVSPAVVFALERANNDLVIWLFALAAAWLVSRAPTARAVAYGLAYLGALLKFYPGVLLALLARERLWRALVAGLLFSGSLVWLLLPETATSMRHYEPDGYGVDQFGAFKLVFAVAPGAERQEWLKLLIICGLAAYALSVSARLVTGFKLLSRMAALPAFEAMMALAGAAMLIACFFAGVSMSYRAIHLLLVLPAIVSLWRAAMDRRGRRFFAAVAGVVVWCLWSQTIWSHIIPLGADPAAMGALTKIIMRLLITASELAWWWLISVLIALTASIVLISPAGIDLRAFLARSTR